MSKKQRLCNASNCKREVYKSNDPANKFGRCEECLNKLFVK